MGEGDATHIRTHCLCRSDHVATMCTGEAQLQQNLNPKWKSIEKLLLIQWPLIV